MINILKTCVILLAMMVVCGAIFGCDKSSYLDLSKTDIIIIEKTTKISDEIDSDTQYLIQTVRKDDHNRIFHHDDYPTIIVTNDKFGNVGDIINLTAFKDE